MVPNVPIVPGCLKSSKRLAKAPSCIRRELNLIVLKPLEHLERLEQLELLKFPKQPDHPSGDPEFSFRDDDRRIFFILRFESDNAAFLIKSL